MCKHTFREVYVSKFDGSIFFDVEQYCFEVLRYENISINVFILSRKIVCVVLVFLNYTVYIQDFIRSKNIRFGNIVIWEILFNVSL